MSERFVCTALPLAGLVRVQRQPSHDRRGLFERIFCIHELAAAGWTQPIAQINHSVTRRRGSLRGLHYQRPPHAEVKLVSCLSGEVWDVAVDLRAGSPTFLRWHAERLSSVNGCALIIPPGFAHGFQTLSDDAELIYLHSAAYVPDAESAVHANDPRLAIPWPLPVTDVSDRDRAHAPLSSSFEGVNL